MAKDTRVKNPLEDILGPIPFEEFQSIYQEIRIRIVGYAVTPELSPKRGVYDFADGMYNRCMVSGDDYWIKLEKDGRNDVIEAARGYDPMDEAVVRFSNGKFFHIKGVDRFHAGKSSAAEIVKSVKK